MQTHTYTHAHGDTYTQIITAFKAADNAEKLGYVAGINLTLQVIFMKMCN